MSRPINEWISAGVAARRLEIGKDAVLARCRDGRLRAMETALGWLVDPDSVDELRIKEEAERGATN